MVAHEVTLTFQNENCSDKGIPIGVTPYPLPGCFSEAGGIQAFKISVHGGIFCHCRTSRMEDEEIEGVHGTTRLYVLHL